MRGVGSKEGENLAGTARTRDCVDPQLLPWNNFCGRARRVNVSTPDRRAAILPRVPVCRPFNLAEHSRRAVGSS